MFIQFWCKVFRKFGTEKVLPCFKLWIKRDSVEKIILNLSKKCVGTVGTIPLIRIMNISTVIDQHGQKPLQIMETLHLEQMPAWGYTMASAALILIGFFGFFLNLFVIILMCKDIQASAKKTILVINPSRLSYIQTLTFKKLIKS